MEDFEQLLILHTREFYKQQSARWISMDTVSTYLAKAVHALEMERALVNERLHPLSTKFKLISACEDMILRGPDRKHLQFILSSDKGVGHMLQGDLFDDLRNMHSVLSNINEQQPMADAMRDHIIKLGYEILQKRATQVEELFTDNKGKKVDEFKTSPQFINALLDLHRKYTALIDKEFNKDELFDKALVQAYQTIMKTEPSDKITIKLTNEKGEFHVSGILEYMYACEGIVLVTLADY